VFRLKPQVNPDPTSNPPAFAVAISLKANKEILATARKRPMKTRKLKNADCELDFFFILRIRWMKFKLPHRFYCVSTVIVNGVRSQNIGAQL